MIEIVMWKSNKKFLNMDLTRDERNFTDSDESFNTDEDMQNDESLNSRASSSAHSSHRASLA